MLPVVLAPLDDLVGGAAQATLALRPEPPPQFSVALVFIDQVVQAAHGGQKLNTTRISEPNKSHFPLFLNALASRKGTRDAKEKACKKLCALAPLREEREVNLSQILAGWALKKRGLIDPGSPVPPGGIAQAFKVGMGGRRR